MGTFTADEQKWIKDALAKEGISKYKLDVSGTVTKGDNFLTDISFVKVSADIGKGEEKNYNFVIKSGKNDEKFRENSPVAALYLREIHIYSEIFPAIDDLQRDYAIENKFTNYAKCYSFSKLDKKEVLILENLKCSGYVLHDKTVPQNFEHTLFVFQTYAKWHGASLALKVKKPNIFKQITKNMDDVMGKFLIQSNIISSFQGFFDKGVEMLMKYGKEDAAKKIRNEAPDIVEILSKMTLCDEPDTESEAVILHGDCWNNNMMFKYDNKNTTKPVDMALLDFQVSRLASPILDLSYYLYSSAEKSTLDKFDYLLEEYYKELSHYLQQFNINCNEILTIQRLKSNWKKYGRLGIVIAPFIIRIVLCQEDEVEDFVDTIGERKYSQKKPEEITSQKKYEERVYNVYNHFVEKFL